MQTIKNGAVIILQRPSKAWPGNRVMLCKWGDKFVTWIVDRDNNAVWGHYFADLVQATQDYEMRR